MKSQKNKGLLDLVKDYQNRGSHRFHMPGHKGRGVTPDLSWGWDVTEIYGMDNLHHPKGAIKKAQERASEVFGANRSFFLVNGSTCGILAAIFACTNPGDEIVMARNCHKSVYHAVELRNLNPGYVLGEIQEDLPFYGSVTPTAVERALKEKPKAKCVVITSPTYEGIISDVKAIADVCHSRGVLLIVDEAHGPHLSLCDKLPKGALECGGDVVIHSLHKTLPSLTQTALLHCNSRVQGDEIARYLGIFETSSPSYLLMTSIDACLEFLQGRGAEELSLYPGRLEKFYDKCGELEGVHLYSPSFFKDRPDFAYDFDPGKIQVNTGVMGIKGGVAEVFLRDFQNIELEMTKETYILAMSSLMNSDDDFTALYRGLGELAKEFPHREPLKITPPPREIPQKVMSIGEALAEPWELVPLVQAAGRVAADYYWEYPPGIPLFTPGEIIRNFFPLSHVDTGDNRVYNIKCVQAFEKN